MGFRYKEGIDILQMLKDKGYTSYRIQKEGLISSSTLTKIRNKRMISLLQIEALCKLLNCHPDEIITYTED